MNRENKWRLRQIVMHPDDLARRVCEWHGGQSSATYSLCSTGMENLVSISMIDAAIDELDRTEYKFKGSRSDKRHLTNVLSDLQTLRTFWKEFSAKAYGLEPQGYDRRDYGMSAEEEAEQVESMK